MLKISYDQEIPAVQVWIDYDPARDGPVGASRGVDIVPEKIRADYTVDGKLIGIEILYQQTGEDLATLEQLGQVLITDTSDRARFLDFVVKQRSGAADGSAA